MYFKLSVVSSQPLPKYPLVQVPDLFWEGGAFLETNESFTQTKTVKLTHCLAVSYIKL